VKTLWLISCLLISLPCASFSQRADRFDPGGESQIASEKRIEELLVRPVCLKSYSESAKSYTIEEVTIPGEDIDLRGELYVPKKPGLYPAIVYVHGGGNDYDLLMSAPKYYAPRLANCGCAVLIYDKRGTGGSGGVFHESTYDDFISDAGHAADFLLGQKRIDPTKIGVYGGSQGGRLAPLVAVRFPSVSFAISASGPIGTLADQATFNMAYALKTRSYEDTTIQQVMPLWKKSHAAWESLNPDDLNKVADEIFKKRIYIDPMALPNTYNEFFTDSNLFFLRPVYNSMSHDYISELVNLDVPWLALYGALDPIINVPESVANIEKQMTTAGNKNCEIIIFKDAEHSFQNLKTGKYKPNINVIINWLNEKMQ